MAHPSVSIRDRNDADLTACEELAREVHDIDGYPPYLPDTTLRRFLASPNALRAWVAHHGTEIVGHVALHPTSSEPVMACAREWLGIGEPYERLGVVARLFVGPCARRSGIGRAFLTTAASEAFRQARWPILDVATEFHAARSLYESCGWTRAGEVTVTAGDGITFREFVYVGPRPRS